MRPYTDTGPVDCDVDVDTSNVKGKVAIITGGAMGIGEAYTRALVEAGAYVIIADLAIADGQQLEQQLGRSVKFVKCDVTKWDDQLSLFKNALAWSPSGRIDVVVANAGISGADPVFNTNIEEETPQEPPLNAINVNLNGVMYTVNLTLHYFRRQHTLNIDGNLDQVLILQGSLAAYLELSGALQYTASKYALRGVMRCLRTTEWKHNIRVAFINPWFTMTTMQSHATIALLKERGIPWATLDDCGDLALKIVADTSINGRSFATLPRTMPMAPRGLRTLWTPNCKVDRDSLNAAGDKVPSEHGQRGLQGLGKVVESFKQILAFWDAAQEVSIDELVRFYRSNREEDAH